MRVNTHLKSLPNPRLFICLFSVFALLICCSQALAAHIIHSPFYSTTIYHPMLRGFPLNACYYENTGCGWQAAHQYCRMMGFDRVVGFRIAPDVGYTRILATKRLCESYTCSGFYWIRCEFGHPKRLE